VNHYLFTKSMNTPFAPVPFLGKIPATKLLVFLLCWPLPSTASEPPKTGPALRTGVEKGTLVIVGGGSLPDLVHRRFLELAGGAKGKLVVIPTAYPKADNLDQLKGYAWWKSQPLGSVVFLHTRNRDQANDPDFVKPLTEATAVWFSGGDQSLLTAAYRGTAVERELHKLLARGCVIGGTSAGAAVMSSVMITGGNPHAQVGQGFGFLSGIVVDQHFQNRNRKDRLLEVLDKNPDYLGLGIDEETAVVVTGGAFTVMGEQKVHFCAPARKSRPARIRLLQAGDHGAFDVLCDSLTAPMMTPAK
jgi:cyanophycinase